MIHVRRSAPPILLGLAAGTALGAALGAASFELWRYLIQDLVTPWLMYTIAAVFGIAADIAALAAVRTLRARRTRRRRRAHARPHHKTRKAPTS